MSTDEFLVTTHAPEQTEALGRALLSVLPAGTVVALRGDLATGKTCLVRGMASVCAAGAPIHSPTFTLVNEYGQNPRLFHIDLYRLSGPDEVADLGYEELFDSDGICVIEWAERAEVLLPQIRLEVHLRHAGGDDRELRFIDHGIMPGGWEQRLENGLAQPTSL